MAKRDPIVLKSSKKADIQKAFGDMYKAFRADLRNLKLDNANFPIAGGRQGIPGVQGPVGAGIQGPQGIQGTINPITEHVYANADRAYDFGTNLVRLRDIYCRDVYLDNNSIKYTGGSLSVEPSLLRPPEFALFFQDSFGGAKFEVAPKPFASDVSIVDAGDRYVSLNVEDALQEIFTIISNKITFYVSSSELTQTIPGTFSTSFDYNPESLIVYRNGLVMDRDSIDRVTDITTNTFRFNLAYTIASNTIVTCSLNKID